MTKTKINEITKKELRKHLKNYLNGNYTELQYVAEISVLLFFKVQKQNESRISIKK